MAKIGTFCCLMMGLLVLVAMPPMAVHAAEDGGAVIPDDTTPAPAPAPADTDTKPAPAAAPAEIDTSTDEGKLQKAQNYESQGKINQALILYLQATSSSDAKLAGQAAYHAGKLFMENKSDNEKAAKLFQFAFAVARYQDAALQAGEAYKAMKNYAQACKMFRWGAMDSTDPGVKTQCAAAFNETLPMFQTQGGASGH